MYMLSLRCTLSANRVVQLTHVLLLCQWVILTFSTLQHTYLQSSGYVKLFSSQPHSMCVCSDKFVVFARRTRTRTLCTHIHTLDLVKMHTRMGLHVFLFCGARYSFIDFSLTWFCRLNFFFTIVADVDWYVILNNDIIDMWYVHRILCNWP